MYLLVTGIWKTDHIVMHVINTRTTDLANGLIMVNGYSISLRENFGGLPTIHNIHQCVILPMFSTKVIYGKFSVVNIPSYVAT